jgi:hypothetical protein
MTQQIGRLALRTENNMWCAYYALQNTMDGAVFLGSIALNIVKNESRKQTFIKLMQEGVADIIEEFQGVRPTWPNPPQPAPESER